MIPGILTEGAGAANVTTSDSIFRHLPHRFPSGNAGEGMRVGFPCKDALRLNREVR